MVTRTSAQPRRVIALGLWVLSWLPLAQITAAGPHATPYAPPYYGQPYQGQPYYFPPQGQYNQHRQQTAPPQYRPIPPTNAQGVPPTYQPAPRQGGMHYPMPGYQPRPPGYPGGQVQQPGSSPPRLDWSLDETQPYLQQPLLLRLELASGDNPSTLNLELPATGDVLMKTLEGPKTRARSMEDGRREIVNGYVLSVIPLRPGNLELPPIKVVGAYGGMTGRFESFTKRPIRLYVRPSMSSVRPWLPAKSLTLSANLDREETLAPGEPVTLTLEIAATGTMAAQLPSLESQLTGPDFRVYREQTLTEDALSKDGRELIARRSEYYTLVPQAGGRLDLPAMTIPWWNLDQGTREVARLPIKTLIVSGGGPLGLSTSVLSGAGSAKFWLPLAGLLLLLAGYWLGVFYRGRAVQTGDALVVVLRRGWRQTRLAASDWARRALARLKPGLALARARSALVRRLPPSSRFLHCVRRANRASDPVEWCAFLEDDARHYPRVKGELAQPSMTRHILLLRPRADRETLTRLMADLDAALYGQRPFDFPRWKRDFMRQVGRGRGLLRPRHDGRRVRWASLPALNPTR